MVFVLSDSVLNLNRLSQPYGIIRLLESMMESEMLEIIIMEIEALKPPKKTIIDIAKFANFCGISIEYNSGFTDCPANKIFPPQAMGKTKILISSRYNGNNQIAVLMCFSFLFSTMVV